MISFAFIKFFALGLAGGAINALAGGGPIIVVAALAAAGIPAAVASLTSTVALVPGQLATGWRARNSLTTLGSPALRRAVVTIALVGGAAGAVLLLVTPSQVFARLLPFLIGFATLLYAWNSRRPLDPEAPARGMGKGAVGWLIPLSVYGGFYGGGNSFMVLALLAHQKVPPRIAAHAKNLLVLLMNAAATAIFLWSGEVSAVIAIPLGIGALAGATAAGAMIDRLDPRWLRLLVIVLGAGLSLWLAVRG